MMKKTIVVFLFFIVTAFNNAANEVYICNSRTAKKYHYSEPCRGLNACKHEVVKIKFDEDKARGYTLCGWEN